MEQNEWVERYLYEVTRRLPEKQRVDIREELETLIEDMLEERSEQLGSKDEKITDVLTELGDPALMAQKYRGENEYLIGGEYYHQYCYLLKIILICTGVGIFIANLISAFVHGSAAEGRFDLITDDFFQMSGIPSVLLQVFAWVTILFIFIEKKNIKINFKEKWEVSDLPQIPYKKEVIKKSEAITGIAFGTFACVLVLFSPQLLGVWVKEYDRMVSIPFFNMDIWPSVLPLFLICIVSGMIKDIMRLIIGRYNEAILLVTMIADVVSFSMIVVLLKVFPIWNPTFIRQTERLFHTTISSSGDILSYWNTATFTNGWLLFLACCFLLEVVVTVYRILSSGAHRSMRVSK